ncbi:mRNA splicing protein prp18 [Geranomyces variabilis]|nr:mRNA splicing protein prp18 [Geranomyces variabilis]
MEAIKAELERKKAALALANVGGAKKYYKRGELEKLREEQYRAEQEKLEAERREKKALKEAALHAARNTTSLLAPGSGPSSPARKAGSANTKNDTAGEAKGGDDDEETEVDYNVAESELVRRFRARDQPIRLFGETDMQRIRRLRLVEATEERSEGQRNDFRAAMAATDQDIVNENLRRKASIGEDGFEDEEGHYRKKRNTKDSERELVDTTILSEELLQTDPDKVYLLMSVYFKRVLREWEKSLDARPEDVKRSVQGRLQAATQGQTAEYMKPFFKQLKKRALQPDVLARVSEIAKLMQEREYLQANDSYLRLSIGNAPWPIGVTMVGIHERSAREKIFSSQVAHALNDETQRKWIQSIKRLMTFAQTKWPPDDHAKMVG